jgi:hypothetical protein
MTNDETKKLLDALEAAEKEALSVVKPEDEGAVLKLVARVRAVIHDAEVDDLRARIAEHLEDRDDHDDVPVWELQSWLKGED